MRILFFGDSITQGFWDTEGGWPQRIRRHYDEQLIPELETLNNDIPTFFNLGISGETTRNLLRRIKPEIEARYLESERMIVVIAIGSNGDIFEANERWVTPEEFRSNLEQLVELVRPFTDKVVLVGNPACDEAKTRPVAWGDYHYTNSELEKSEATIKAVAAAHQLLFVPLFASFKSRLDNGEILLADGLHPNDVGHAYIASQVLPVLEGVMRSLQTV